YNQVKVYNERGDYEFKNDSSFVILVSKNGLEGLLDHKGNTVLPLEYTKAEPHKNYVRLVKGEKLGIYFFDPALKAIPIEYDRIKEEFPTGYLIANKDKVYDLFDPHGKLISGNNTFVDTYRSSWARSHHSQILIINDQKKHGIYSTKEKRFTLPVAYDWIGDAYGDDFIVKRKKKFGVVDDKGETIIPLSYDTLAYLNPKKTLVRLKASKKNKYGLITATNKSLSPFAYDDIESINHFFKVKLKEGYSVIDSLGKRITTATYDHVGSFHNGRSAVFAANKFGYMDTNGVIVSPIEQPSPARGFATLPDLFKGFVKALKSENDSILLEFAKDVVVDEYTRELMLRMNYEYRGFPKRGKKMASSIDQVVKNYYKSIKYFRDELKQYGELQSLVFTGLDRDKVGYWEEHVDIPGTETRGKLKSNKRDYNYKLGELLYLDGYWKSFTEPRQ
ncbi:MAG TPA: WG repeat-containing protein, partial [Cyclobacteriaceae bacterium]